MGGVRFPRFAHDFASLTRYYGTLTVAGPAFRYLSYYTLAEESEWRPSPRFRLNPDTAS